MKRIHIVGSGPRTGTTLMVKLMSTCFKIDHAVDHESLNRLTDQQLKNDTLLTVKTMKI